MNDCHDWNNPVIPWQGAIDVYRNPFDQIVIRQEPMVQGDDDACISISPANVSALITALLNLVEREDE